MLMVQSIGDLDTDGNRVAPPVQQADTVGAPITAPYEPETIAVVEDEYFTREGICDALRDAGWDVEAFSSCEDFLAVQESRPSPCVVLDIHFPGMGGLELLSRLSQMPNSSPVIVVSGSSAIAEAVQSMRDGALDFIFTVGFRHGHAGRVAADRLRKIRLGVKNLRAHGGGVEHPVLERGGVSPQEILAVHAFDELHRILGGIDEEGAYREPLTELLSKL